MKREEILLETAHNIGQLIRKYSASNAEGRAFCEFVGDQRVVLLDPSITFSEGVLELDSDISGRWHTRFGISRFDEENDVLQVRYNGKEVLKGERESPNMGKRITTYSPGEWESEIRRIATRLNRIDFPYPKTERRTTYKIKDWQEE